MPDSIAQQPVCGNWQPVEPDWTGSGQANSPEKGKISADSTETQCETGFYSLSNGHCMDPSGWPHAPDFSFLQENFSICNKSFTKDFDKRPNMYFQKLMAMADAGGNQPAIIQNALSKNFAAESVRLELGASSSCFHGSCVLPPPIESGQYKMCYKKPRPCSPVIGQRFGEEPEFASLPAGASSSSTMPSNTACFRGKCKSLPWEPITPQKTNKAEYYQLMKPPVIDQTEMEKSKSLIIDQSSSVTCTSTQLQESHKPDKGGLDLAGLLKTPQQKARRKKHRPKVIIEGEKSGPKTTKKPNGPKESPNVTRKYIRRKGVVESELCRETDVNDSNRKETTLLDTPPAKRKYVRRKGVTKREVEVDGDITKTAAVNASQIARRSCKQALTFNLDSEAREQSSFQYPSSNSDGEPQGENHNTNYQSTTLRCEQGMMKKDDVMNSHESTQSLDRTHYAKLTKGKCPIVFPNVTRNKETITVQVRAPSGQSAPRSPNVSLCSSTYWVPQTQLYAQQVSALKRQNTNASVEWEISHRNEAGTRYNFVPAYFPTFSQKVDKNNAPSGVHSPIIYKRRRTEKGYSIGTSSSQLEKHALGDSCTRHITSMANQACNIYNLSRTNTANGAIQAGWRAYEDCLDLGCAKRIRKKRSKGSTRPRDLSSLLEICRQQLASTSESAATPSRMKQKIAILRKPPTCMEAYVADTTQTTLKTKNCAKRRLLSDSMPQNLYNCQHSATIPMGPPLALTWRTISPVDSIMEQLRRLDLNATSQPSKKKGNAFTTYHSHYQEQHALVPFQRGGALIPFERPRRRRLRAKVNLDDETNRVWKLLIEDINSEGIDGTDEEKTKWWEEERRVFIGRADSFIARMHLVQGDRRFSPWKGSVVDSVVGVFLTQNVSDHLSSSAFMSVAARFPPKSKTEPAEFHEVDLGTKEICELDRDGTFGLNDDISSKSVYSDRHLVFEDDIRESSENAAIKSISFIEDGRDAEDAICSQTPEFSSQNSSNSPMAQATERSYSCLPSTSEEPKAWAKLDVFDNSISFIKLLQMAGTVVRKNYEEDSQQINSDVNHCQSGSLALELQNEVHMDNPVYPAQTMSPSSKSTLCDVVNAGSQASVSDPSKENSPFFSSSTSKDLCLGDISELSSESASGIAFQKITDVCSQNEPKHVSRNATSSSNDQGEINRKIVENQNSQVPVQSLYEEIYCIQEVSKEPIYPQNLTGITNSSCNIDNLKNLEQMEVNSNKNDSENHHGKMVDGSKGEGGRPSKDMDSTVHWDQLRKEATDAGGKETSRTANTMDSVDWDAVRCADVNELAETIKERGMNNRLAERIKDFLDRLVRDHGSIDLEWLRDVLPDKAKEYLLSIRGLGLKSVECVRLLTLHHLAFPVDTNVGRIAVRLGWVPLQQLPESLQLHLLELYPVLESIQKYLWPRLCKLDQRTLYELHYQMITFGKVFCTKSKPNCNACPMRGECRHFASAFASARLSLPAPEEKRIVSTAENRTADQNPMRSMNTLQLPSSETNHINARSAICNSEPIIEEPPSPEPIIQMPATPEQDCTEVSQCDIENAINEDPDEIPSIELNMEEFTHNLQMIMEQNTELQEGDMSKALVALTSAAASIPVPKLKNVSRLRTEHQVYELPDSHPLLEGMDKREPDDPSPYLLAIWTPGETVDSIEPPERRCNSSNFNKLCTDEACLSCNSIREAGTLTVRGTLLIPCRTAMRGSFPLNGTYFQVNEVFSDHESSLSPIVVPREWLWNLPKRTVFFGTSIPTIFKGLTTEGIQYCFWRGFVCVRGFDRKTRAPRPLIARLHFPASKMAKQKGKMDEK